MSDINQQNGALDGFSHLYSAQYNQQCLNYARTSRHREMMAADLGLPIQYDGKWTDFTFDQDFLWWGHVRALAVPAALYAFWLGAEG